MGREGGREGGSERERDHLSGIDGERVGKCCNELYKYLSKHIQTNLLQFTRPPRQWLWTDTNGQ